MADLLPPVNDDEKLKELSACFWELAAKAKKIRENRTAINADVLSTQDKNKEEKTK